MSTQGTGSLVSLSFERRLLDAWGVWARGDIGLGYNHVDWMKKGGVGLMFCDDDLLLADMAIARLPKQHKRIIKQVYLQGKIGGTDEAQRHAAVASFAESLAGDGP